jgi:all-trans-retinol dehydrogenase (NAD+)
MALDFAKRGARVVVWGRNPEALREMEMAGQKQNCFIKAMSCDVSDRVAVYRCAEQVKVEVGPVDILINNAGVVSGATILDTPDEQILSTIGINTLALFWTTKAFLPDMLARNSGHLVTIASAAGIIGVTGLADYSASKFGAFGYHEAVDMELRKNKSAVKTTLVCPYYIDTGMFEGVKTRFPLLLPILNSNAVAHRIVQSILKDRKFLVMPPFVRNIFWLRMFLAAFFDWTVDLLGINHTMDHFTGRKA